jgi:hypothetical protein
MELMSKELLISLFNLAQRATVLVTVNEIWDLANPKLLQ